MKTIIRNILLPVDVTDASLNALNTAIHMAERHQANLHLLYVQDIRAFYPQIGQAAQAQTIMQETFAQNVYLLEQVAVAVTLERQINCRFETIVGFTASAINNYAAEKNADLIIMGMPEDLHKAPYLNDSIPFKVLLAAPCHVMTVPVHAEVNDLKRIVYPIQGQGVPMAKFPIASAIMAKNDPEVSVVKVFRSDDLGVLGSISGLADRVRAKARRVARTVRTRPLFTNNPARALGKLCREEAADLVIIEADTRRNLKEYFFGNFTQKMMRNPDTAVLCVKTEQVTGSQPALSIAHSRNLQWS